MQGGEYVRDQLRDCGFYRRAYQTDPQLTLNAPCLPVIFRRRRDLTACKLRPDSAGKGVVDALQIHDLAVGQGKLHGFHAPLAAVQQPHHCVPLCRQLSGDDPGVSSQQLHIRPEDLQCRRLCLPQLRHLAEGEGAYPVEPPGGIGYRLLPGLDVESEDVPDHLLLTAAGGTDPDGHRSPQVDAPLVHCPTVHIVRLGDQLCGDALALSAQLHRPGVAQLLPHTVYRRAVLGAVQHTDLHAQLVGQHAVADGVAFDPGLHPCLDDPEDLREVIRQNIIKLRALLLHAAVQLLTHRNDFPVHLQFHLGTSFCFFAYGAYIFGRVGAYVIRREFFRSKCDIRS